MIENKHKYIACNGACAPSLPTQLLGYIGFSANVHISVNLLTPLESIVKYKVYSLLITKLKSGTYD